MTTENKSFSSPVSSASPSFNRERIIKVCGLRDGENIRAVEAAGADWFGFIFYPRSPRFCNDVPSYLPTRGERVGVFVHPTFRDVTERARQFGLTAVQFHGKASAEMCAEFRSKGLKVIRAIATTETFVSETAEYVGKVDYFLFDTPTLKFGGSGRRYDWTLLDRYTASVLFLLSGGLSPASVSDIRTFSHPALVGYDLNSGFETAPGIKDAHSIEQFIKDIR